MIASTDRQHGDPALRGGTRRLAILGSPVAHSKSPILHSAAYGVLGLPWEYSAIDVGSGELAGFISSLDSSWQGLSLTMPVKREALELLATRDDLIELTGVANTMLFQSVDGVPVIHGFNTDVYGITTALLRAGVGRLGTVQVLGSGATAASAIVAVSGLGATRILVSARNPVKAVELVELGTRLGIDVIVSQFAEHDRVADAPDLVISTLPNGVQADLSFGESMLEQSVLFDAAYHPWPTPLAAQWLAAGGRVVSGLEMLVHQAVAQVRIFVGGDPKLVLPEEDRVLEAMLHSVGLPLTR
jgi:shikimate dehydrogenase